MDATKFEKLKKLVDREIILSPDNARELIREIETAQRLLDRAGIPVKDTLSERVAYLVGKCEGLELIAK